MKTADFVRSVSEAVFSPTLTKRIRTVTRTIVLFVGEAWKYKAALAFPVGITSWQSAGGRRRSLGQS